MEELRQAITVMAADDTRWGPRDTEGRRRQLTADELDDLADFRWPWTAMMGSLAAGVSAMLSRLRRRDSNRIQPTPLPSAEATAQG